jgi:aminoglycoside phosphotransferase (APT) family kinase protein
VSGPPAAHARLDADRLDAAALVVWLHTHAPALLGDGSTPLVLTRFPGGFSNLTYRVDGGARPFVLRRPPHGVTPGTAHDMVREYRALGAVHAAGLPVPAPLALCEDASVLGAPFFLMAHVDGVILRGAPPDGVRFDAETAASLAATFVRQLAALHAVDVEAAGLASLGRGDGYVQRQVQGWTARWQRARREPVPALDEVAQWLEASRPPDRSATLVHNDYKLDNLVLDPDDLTRVRAILDWEMATVGDPLLDLGTTLAYWMEADDPPLLRALGLGVTAAPGMPTRHELVARYAAASGREVPDPVFPYVFGTFKVAVIAQQIAARHADGLASDARFARLPDAVRLLGARARAAISRGVIGRT